MRSKSSESGNFEPALAPGQSILCNFVATGILPVLTCDGSRAPSIIVAEKSGGEGILVQEFDNFEIRKFLVSSRISM